MTIKREDFKVQRTATGLGLFLLRPIAAGRRIIEYVGTVISAEEVERVGGKYLFGLGDGRSIDGRARANLARYVNHSCRPNAEAFVTGRRVWIWSKRAIGAGEELTLDYGEEYFDQYIKPVGCRCEVCAARARRKAARAAAKSRAKRLTRRRE